MVVKPIPEGYHSVTPYLVAERVDNLIDFLKKAFGAVEKHRNLRPDGSIAHAEVRIGDSPIMMGGASEQWKAMPAAFYHYVNDVDAAFKRALDAGGKSLSEPADMFYGDRSGGVVDPSGNIWWLATHKEDVSDEEIARRGAAQGK